MFYLVVCLLVEVRLGDENKHRLVIAQWDDCLNPFVSVNVDVDWGAMKLRPTWDGQVALQFEAFGAIVIAILVIAIFHWFLLSNRKNLAGDGHIGSASAFPIPAQRTVSHSDSLGDFLPSAEVSVKSVELVEEKIVHLPFSDAPEAQI